MNDKEGSVKYNIEYQFDSTSNSSTNKDISILTHVMNYIPYTDKAISSILYELYERAKYNTSISPFNNDAIGELSDVEYDNLKEQVIDDAEIVDALKKNVTSRQALISQMEASMTKYIYYQDQFPTTQYIKDGLNDDFKIEEAPSSSNNIANPNSQYTQLSQFLNGYKAESYRTAIYPFNSSTYLSYLNQSAFTSSNLDLHGMLSVNPPHDFITSPQYAEIWAKDGYTTNMFTNTLGVNGIYKNILNTPYFHKQLYNDYFKTQSIEKYAGSAYLLLNSLPFKDLDDTISNTTLQALSNQILGNDSTLVSSLFREIGASHYIPYHMMLKWGSIYHRYKKWITEGVDIIPNVTDMIDGKLYFDNYYGLTYTGLTSGKTVSEGSPLDIGFHPYYDDIFCGIVNGYGFFDTSSAVSNYADMIAAGVTKLYYLKPEEQLHGQVLLIILYLPELLIVDIHYYHVTGIVMLTELTLHWQNKIILKLYGDLMKVQLAIILHIVNTHFLRMMNILKD